MKLVIQNMSRVWGGNEKWLSMVARGLIDRGHDVTVSCVKGKVSENLETLGIPTTNHRARGDIDFVSALDFAAYLRKEKPDCLLMTSWRLTWTVVAARLANVDRMVMRLGIVRDFPQSGPRSHALRSVNALIVNSEEIRDTWLRTKPVDTSDEVYVVLNTVKPRFDLRLDLRRRLRDELEVDDNSIVIGGAGHLAARKGFDILLRAFANSEAPDSVLVIIGDGESRADLESLAASLGISGKVRFLGHRDNAADLIAGLDLFVLSSHNEGMANVMLEAMAGGAPVIAAEISGVNKAIAPVDGRPAAGWTFEAANNASLAARIDHAVSAIRSDSHELSAITAEARWRIENWFTASRMIDECERILFPA
jgi:glycosyltransferase involved in cell wall biosynthesis